MEKEFVFILFLDRIKNWIKDINDFLILASLDNK